MTKTPSFKIIQTKIAMSKILLKLTLTHNLIYIHSTL